MSLLLQLAKDVLLTKIKGVLNPALVMALSIGSGIDKGLGALGGDLASGTAIREHDHKRKSFDIFVQIEGPNEYLKDYAYFDRKDWARALLLLNTVESGTLYLVDLSSTGMSGQEFVVFSIFDANIKTSLVAAKLQKRNGGVKEGDMTNFLTAIVKMAERGDAHFRDATSAAKRVRAE